MSRMNQTQDETVFEDAMNQSFSYALSQTHALQKLPNAIDFQFHQPENANKSMFESPPQDRVEEPAITQADLTQFRLHQVKSSLAASKLNMVEDSLNKQDSTKSHPIYYRPPSSNIKDTQFGIQNFLPPNVKLGANKIASETNRVPLFVNKPVRQEASVDEVFRDLKEKKRPDIDEEELDDADDSSPSGEWTNPIMIEALSRQVNKEEQTKKAVINVLLLVVVQFFKALVRQAIELYESRKHAQLQMQYQLHHNPAVLENKTIGNIRLGLMTTGRLVTGLLLVNIVIALLQLSKGQNQCYDLPLSDTQRRLIGLEVNREPAKIDPDFDQEQQAELTLKQRRHDAESPARTHSTAIPKYVGMNPYSQYNFSDAAKVNFGPSRGSQNQASAQAAMDLARKPPKAVPEYEVTPQELARFVRNSGIHLDK